MAGKRDRARAPQGGSREPLLIAILSRNRKLYSTRRLAEAARERGHDPRILDTLRCNMLLARGEARLFYRGSEIRDLDVVIPRIGASITGYGLAVVNHLDMMGVPVLANFPAGHGPENWALPLGIQVRLDADSRTLESLEPATL